MENPWASPWATNDTDDTSQPTSTPAANPEPPPPAFFSSTPNNLSIPPSHSAWEDDNSFGDWASPEPTPAPAPAATNGSAGWGIWGTTDTAPADGQLTPRYEGRRKGSSPQWPSSRSTSPGLRPPPLSKRSSTDHLSLDPWSSEPSFNRRDEPETHIQPLPSLPTAFDQDPKALRTRPSIISINIEPQSPPRPSVEPNSNAPSLRLDTAVSPSTSTSDAEGLTGVAHDDSPITPAEELSASPDTGKKASKVQELVTMYDGITRKTSFTPELVPGPKRSVSRDTPSREGTPIQQTPTPILTPDDADLKIIKTRKSIPENDAPSADEEPSVEEIAVSPEITSPVGSASELATSQNQGLETEGEGPDKIGAPAKIAHEPFKVDLTKIEELLPGPQSHVTGDDVTVPDHVITDSFENISERKAWYRLSRFGPMRQHNTGDDENYVRISWASSSIRPEIIQTVRRWMEEDSMGGRLFRGGLINKAAGGTAFGWNQPSTPVSLEEFFRRGRSGQATPEQNPRQSFSGPPAAAVGSIRGEQRPLSMPVAPQAAGNEAWNGPAAFGWASSTPQSSVSVAGPAGPTQAPLKLQDPPKKSMAPPALPLSTSKAVESEDEDDEWGEMVTPSVQDFPNKQPAFGWANQTGPPSEPQLQSPKDSFIPSPSLDAKRVSFAEQDHNITRPSLDAGDWAASTDLTKRSSFQEKPSHSRTNSATMMQAAENGPATPAMSPSQSWDSTDSSPATMSQDIGLAQHIIQGLPDLSYMLR